MQYTTVCKNVNRLEDFDSEINDLLNSGYRLIGSFQVAVYLESVYLLQGMIKTEDEPDNQAEDIAY